MGIATVRGHELSMDGCNYANKLRVISAMDVYQLLRRDADLFSGCIL